MPGGDGGDGGHVSRKQAINNKPVIANRERHSEGNNRNRDKEKWGNL